MKTIIENNKGFTLIEGMVVIAIIGILMGAFSSSMIRWLPDYRFNNYILELQGALQSARLAAVKNNADVFVQFDKSNQSFKAFLDDTSDAANRGILDGGDSTIAAPDTPKGVVFTQLFGTGDLLSLSTFNSRGLLDRAGRVELKNGNDSYKGVRMTLAGNSRIIKSGDGGTTWQ